MAGLIIVTVSILKTNILKHKFMNKTEAQKKLQDLQYEVDKLKEIINAPEYKVEDIKSLRDACKVLGIEFYNITSFSEQLKTIIKAVNFIDNENKEWKPNFGNYNEYKYIPYFEFNKRSGWSLYCVGGYYSFSIFPLGFYFKNKKSAEYIAKQFLTLYNSWLEE